jgi:hypothetical protein
MRGQISKIMLRAALIGSALCVNVSASSATEAVQGVTGGTNFPAFNGTNQTIGWYFSTNAILDVTALGVYSISANLSQSHQIGIWDSAGLLLGSATLAPSNGAADTFRYVQLANPFSLQAGNTYTIGSDITSPFTDIYRSGASSITTDPSITFLGAARNASSGGFSNPDTLTAGTLGRFGPSFQFTSAVNAVPEPSTWAMMISGFGLVGGVMRRRKITVQYA